MFDRLKRWTKPPRTGVVLPAEAQTVPPAAPQPVAIPDDVLTGIGGLIQPGAGVTLPAAQIVEAKPMAAAPEPVQAAEPVNPDTRPVDWDEESRIDLPPRTPGRIAYLLRFETAAQIQARILNDGARYRIRRG